jgi:NADPH:quinone reductase
MPKVVRFHKTGPAEVLQIEEMPLQEPGAGEIRIAVKALGLNRAEVMFRYGMYLETPILPARIGYEAAGTVDAIGANVTGFKVGDRVSTIPAFPMSKHGVYGETAVIPARAVAHYCEKLSVEEGTSIWMQYLTAWGGLVHYGKLQAGQSVLITAGGSSVAIASIQIAKALGAKAIVTTRTSAKKKVLLEAGASEVIATEEEDLVARVMQATNGEGANLVFDPIAGPMLEKLALATRYGGQIIEYGALATERTPFPLFTVLGKALVIRGYTLFEFSKADKAVLEKGVAFVNGHLENGAFKPRIDHVFPFEKIVDAHRYMESNVQIGKIVVTVP